MERSSAKDYLYAAGFALLAAAIIAGILASGATFDMAFSKHDPIWAIGLFCAPMILFWVLIAAVIVLPNREPSKGACLCFLGGLLPGCIAVVMVALFLHGTFLILPFSVVFASAALGIWWQGALAIRAARKDDAWTGQVPNPTGRQLLVIAMAVALLLSSLKVAFAPVLNPNAQPGPAQPTPWKPGDPVEAEKRAQ